MLNSLDTDLFGAAAPDPTEQWERIQDSQSFVDFRKVAGGRSLSWDASKVTRIVCISDTHGLHKKLTVPEGDILVHAGDFTNTGEQKQVEELSELFGDWNFPADRIFIIAGNHDTTFHASYYESIGKGRFHANRKVPYEPATVKAALKNCTYLEDSGSTVIVGDSDNDGKPIGLSVYGSPWQPEFCNWAFNLPRGKACLEAWSKIPAAVDILVTHGPPLGRGDLCLPAKHRGGCADLLHEVQNRIKPRLHIFGHIHEGFGTSSDGTTVFANASTCTFNYSPTNSAIVFDLPHDRSQMPAQVLPQLDWTPTQVVDWLRNDSAAYVTGEENKNSKESKESKGQAALDAIIKGFEDAIANGDGIDGNALITALFQDLKERAQIPLGPERNVLLMRISQLRASCYGTRAPSSAASSCPERSSIKGLFPPEAPPDTGAAKLQAQPQPQQPKRSFFKGLFGMGDGSS